jgi:hypothetical protein
MQKVEAEISARMAYDARRRAWAEHHDLRSVPHPCLSKLLGERCADERAADYWGHSCALHRPPHPDHDTMWRPKEGRWPALYLNQPYDWSDEDVDATAALCADRGLEWTVDPHAAWHYPGHVTGVVIWNPARCRYEPGPVPEGPPPGPALVKRKAQQERARRARSHSAYESLCQALDALFYPTHADRAREKEYWQRDDLARYPEPDGELSEDDLVAIEQRCRAATPGPWQWTQDVVNEYIRARGRGSWRDLYLYILQGRGPRYQDSWDANVLRLQWSQIKGTTFCGHPREEDAAFIAAARTDVPRLVAALRQAHARIAALEAAQRALQRAANDDEDVGIERVRVHRHAQTRAHSDA